MSGFDWNVITSNWQYLAKGLQYTFQVTLVGTIGGVLLGTILALMRLSPVKPLSLFAAAYVNLFRSIPLVFVLLAFYLIAPILIGFFTGRPQPVGADRSAYYTFTIFEAAFFSEIMRSGIQSIPRGQIGAGYAMGFTYSQVMKLVVLPQAFRNMLPVLLTQTIVLFQDTSLVYVISLTDFLGAASKIAQRDGRLVEMYVFAALVYFVISFALSQLVRTLQARFAVKR